MIGAQEARTIVLCESHIEFEQIIDLKRPQFIPHLEELLSTKSSEEIFIEEIPLLVPKSFLFNYLYEILSTIANLLLAVFRCHLRSNIR